jgi:iron complex outermembrane receptor protein
MTRPFRHACQLSAATLVATLCAAPFPVALAAAAPVSGAEELTGLSLEELGNIVVTSVSKKPEQLLDAPASIYVITHDDIRRSGVTTLPDALRLAPNLEVAQTSSSQYVISSRGFIGSAGNKMLVLIDGRSVYTPLFSGVFWDTKEVMLEDIDRIEVISGPGSTLWGVNAVNGVINIITRPANESQGGLIAVGAGSMQNTQSARYGGTFGSNSDGSGGVSYRVYATTFDDRHTELGDGTPSNDGWHFGQTGFRMDWSQNRESLSVQGNAYNGAEAQPLPGEISISGFTINYGPVWTSGANLSVNWMHHMDDGASLNVMSYFDRTLRDAVPTFNDKEDIYDLQIVHTLAPMASHTITWGGEYRRGDDNVGNSPYIAFLPASLNQKWASLYAQDQWSLREALQLTLGARVERNIYTGNEFLPNVRLAWHPSSNNLLWAAYSRTVREPSRFDHDLYAPGSPPYLLAGGPNVVSEIARVFELGYRTQATPALSYSVTLYHALYDHLLTENIDFSIPDVVFGNGMRGSTTGIEAWGNYLLSKTWRISAGLSTLREYVNFYQPGATEQSVYNPGQDAPLSYQLRTSLDLPQQTELDLTLRHVAALSNPDVPAYTVLGGRIGWTPMHNLELSMTVQNLIGSGHTEFGSMATSTEFDRNVYFKAVARF